jgi:hypothetical protein
LLDLTHLERRALAPLAPIGKVDPEAKLDPPAPASAFWTSAMDDVRALAMQLQSHLKPNRGRTPEVPYVMAAILLARNPHLGGRGACRLVDGADENAGHSRVSSLAAKVQSMLTAADDTMTPVLLPAPVPPLEHDRGLQVVNGDAQPASALARRWCRVSA